MFSLRRTLLDIAMRSPLGHYNYGLAPWEAHTIYATLNDFI